MTSNGGGGIYSVSYDRANNLGHVVLQSISSPSNNQPIRVKRRMVFEQGLGDSEFQDIKCDSVNSTSVTATSANFDQVLVSALTTPVIQSTSGNILINAGSGSVIDVQELETHFLTKIISDVADAIHVSNSSGQLLLGNDVSTGTATRPAIAITGGTATGSPMYNNGFFTDSQGTIHVTIQGVDRFSIGSTSCNTVNVLNVGAGTAASPALQLGANNLGFYGVGSGEIAFSTAGVNRGSLTSTRLAMSVPIYLPNGTNTAPTFTFQTDTNTGMYRVGGDNLGFTAGGILCTSINTTRLQQTGFGQFSGGVQLGNSTQRTTYSYSTVVSPEITITGNQTNTITVTIPALTNTAGVVCQCTPTSSSSSLYYHIICGARVTSVTTVEIAYKNSSASTLTNITFALSVFQTV